MNIYDKKFVRFKWDDSLTGKKVVYGDSIYDLKCNLEHNRTVTVKSESESDAFPFRVTYDDGRYNAFRFVYYDPLLEYKQALVLYGRRVQFRVFSEHAGGSEWHDIDRENDGFVWDEKFEYHIFKEEAKPERLTKRKLSQWLAQGNGEIMCDGGDTMSVAFIYPLGEENEEVTGQFLVRRWKDTEWHKPTVDYCFPSEEK